MPKWKHKLSNLYRVLAVGADSNQYAKIWLLNKYGRWVQYPGSPVGTASPSSFFKIFYLSYDCIWIGGRNGIAQSDSPLLYYYNGNQWINLSSELSSLSSDLDDVMAIHGISKDCIYIAGNANSPGGDYGRIFKWDGSELSLEYSESGNHGYYGVCVTPNETVYVCGNYWIRFKSSGGETYQDISVLEAPYNYGNVQFIDINCYSNTEIVTAPKNSPYYYKFNGVSWSSVYSGSGSDAYRFDGNSFNDIWGVKVVNSPNVEYFNGSSSIVYTSSNVPWDTTNINNVSMISSNDAWFCGKYRSAWGNAVLSHWDGSSFSDHNDYNVGSMGAYEIHDAAHAIDL